MNELEYMGIMEVGLGHWMKSSNFKFTFFLFHFISCHQFPRLAHHSWYVCAEQSEGRF